MTLENSKRLLAHYEAAGMKAEANDMRTNLARRGVKETPVKTK